MKTFWDVLVLFLVNRRYDNQAVPCVTEWKSKNRGRSLKLYCVFGCVCVRECVCAHAYVRFCAFL